MSKDAQADYNFWQCVACVICHLPFSTPSGPTVPFWLTECGHIICNNHLKADQSCARCASEGIQLVPLQQEMDAPMADWFRPVADSLDTVAFAAKFQFENMATQLHHHKYRYQQIKVFIDRLKREIVDLKKWPTILLGNVIGPLLMSLMPLDPMIRSYLKINDFASTSLGSVTARLANSLRIYRISTASDQ